MAKDAAWSSCHLPDCTAAGRANARACRARTRSSLAAQDSLPNDQAWESPWTRPRTPAQQNMAVSIWSLLHSNILGRHSLPIDLCVAGGMM